MTYCTIISKCPIIYSSFPLAHSTLLVPTTPFALHHNSPSCSIITVISGRLFDTFGSMRTAFSGPICQTPTIHGLHPHHPSNLFHVVRHLPPVAHILFRTTSAPSAPTALLAHPPLELRSTKRSIYTMSSNCPKHPKRSICLIRHSIPSASLAPSAPSALINPSPPPALSNPCAPSSPSLSSAPSAPSAP